MCVCVCVCVCVDGCISAVACVVCVLEYRYQQMSADL